MRQLLRMTGLLVGTAPRAMARGAALSVAVLVMGAALLGLSGWFITATGIAGLAGIGLAFDVFRPSAGVRFLALGRTAARYGERLLTHDAILRALAALRVAILRHQSRRDARALARLRGETVLTRVISDVDALDGLVLRVILPVAAGLVTHCVVVAMLHRLVGGPVAVAIAGLYLPAAAAVLWSLARRSESLSERAEHGGQTLRRGLIDMIRDREALVLSGGLPAREDDLVALDAVTRADAARLDRMERGAGALLSVIATVAVVGAFLTGGLLLAQGGVGPATAVIGLFVALALTDTILPLRRGFADLGRISGAARRVRAAVSGPPDGERPALVAAPDLRIARPEVTLDLRQGEAVALTGASGSGKSTLLLSIAGLLPAQGITVAGRAPEGWSEESLRARVTLLPQRSALIAGTIRDNLCLAGAFSDADLWSALEAAQLTQAVRARGGLEARLGERGQGLSGGQARRLALARCLLRRPDLFLLDEPTEGLDDATATALIYGVRNHLPRSALLVALHRGADHPVFDRVFTLPEPP